jgi:hypothetical protein
MTSEEQSDKPKQETKPKTVVRFVSRMRLYLLLILALVLAMVINEVMSGRSAMFQSVPGTTQSANPGIPRKSVEPATISPKFFEITVEGAELFVKGRKVEIDECVRLAAESDLPIMVVFMPSALTSAEESLKAALKVAGLAVDARVTPNIDPETGEIKSYSTTKQTQVPPTPAPAPTGE